MFERFTDRARRVVVLAQEEARRLDHNYIGTEHLLLGLLKEGTGVGASALGSLGLSLDAVRSQIEDTIGTGEVTPPGNIPFTPRTKKVLELSLREARRLGHDYIGTEHILLGIIREGEGVAAQVLGKLDVGLDEARQAVLQRLGTAPAAAEEPAWTGAAEDMPVCPSCGRSLEGHLRVRILSGGEGEAFRARAVTFCDRCGAAIPTLLE